MDEMKISRKRGIYEKYINRLFHFSIRKKGADNPHLSEIQQTNHLYHNAEACMNAFTFMKRHP